MGVGITRNGLPFDRSDWGNFVERKACRIGDANRGRRHAQDRPAAPDQRTQTGTAAYENQRDQPLAAVNRGIAVFLGMVIVATAALLSAALAGAQEPGAMIEWPHVGAEQAHTKYSAAEGITAANTGELEIVWQ